MVTLTIDGVNCSYGSVDILKDINFGVNSGEFLGILGPNGSGKTTLLKSISRVLKPKKGTILIDKENIYAMKSLDVAKQMAVVPQSTPVSFDFTALEVVLMGRNPHMTRFKMEGKKDLDIAKDSMELTHTWEFADRPITELSGGEIQRVIIARALTQEPKILLLDEPTTHLDISNQLEIMDLIKHLCETQKLLIVAVFHDFNLAARYCDSIILLKDGKIVAAGKSNETLTSENVKKVFSVDTIVKHHPITGSLHVIPISRPILQQQKSLIVHLISGGGTGSPVMKTLLDEGYRVTAGVLNLLDTDHETAQLLSVPTTNEAPFSPITNEAHKANLQMISKADVLVVTPTQFGDGNLRNLEAAETALDNGIATILLENGPMDERDFTNGKATEYLNKLKNKGATTLQSIRELVTFINNLESKNNKENHKANKP
ncbi:MAG: heme ABC transporter ATP-binding protein [Candidatus Bathyarchaeum sp.]|nr:MAG: heme ABC transporter ATP-binding protein [Candidatus Bathyarchaeum sp.]